MKDNTLEPLVHTQENVVDPEGSTQEADLDRAVETSFGRIEAGPYCPVCQIPLELAAGTGEGAIDVYRCNDCGFEGYL